MKTPWFTFLFPPKFTNYEQTQIAKLLHYMLISALLGSVVIGTINFINGWVTEAALLMVFAIICLFGFYLNSTSFSQYVGLILCLSFFLVINLMLYNGLGLYDETVMAFPVFMIFTSFLFGRRGLWVATILSILVVAAFYILQKYGLFQSNYVASSTRVFILSSLLVITALVIWVVRSFWEMNLVRLRESYDLTLQGWAKALEYRDGETAGHTRRVTELCVALAKKLGLSNEEIRNLQRGAYLHDIGKMAIPDHILLKAGPLTEEEWELMRQHPLRAGEFILRFPSCSPLSRLPTAITSAGMGRGIPKACVVSRFR